MKTTPYTFDRVIRILIALTILTAIFFLLRRLSSVLLPFFVAWLLAYMLNPLVKFFQFKLKIKNRLVSVILTLISLVLIIGGVLAILTPLISAEFERLTNIITNYQQSIDINTIIPKAWQKEFWDYVSRFNIQKALHDPNLMNLLKELTPKFWELINSSFDLLLSVVVVLIVLLYLIFILLDYDNISEGMYKIIPPKYKQIIVEIIEDLKVGMNRYFRGQALIAAIVGVLFCAGFSIIGLPLAIVMGLLIGLFTLVPYLKVVGLVPAILLSLLKSVETNQSFASILISVLVVFATIQVIEDLFLVPRIMGKVTGLNPAVIMLSLSVWGTLIGVIGMIIALPVTTLLISYYNRFVLHPNISNETKEIEASN